MLPAVNPVPGDPRGSRVPALTPERPVQAFGGTDLPASQLGYPEAPGPDSRLDALKYLDIVLKHRRLLLIAAALSLCFGVAVNLLTTPLYRASATIKIDRESAKVVDVRDVQAVEGGSDLQFYQTQFELLRSRALAQRVVADLGLADDPDMLQVRGPCRPRPSSGNCCCTAAAAVAARRSPVLPTGRRSLPTRSCRASRSSRSPIRGWRA